MSNRHQGDEPVQRVTDGEIFCLRCWFGLQKCWKDEPRRFPYCKTGIDTITEDSFVVKPIESVGAELWLVGD